MRWLKDDPLEAALRDLVLYQMNDLNTPLQVDGKTFTTDSREPEDEGLLNDNQSV